MVIRLCSILGTLALLLSAVPASAAEGGKKKGKGSARTQQSESQADDADAELAEEEAYVEPDAWEAPPPDEEKPPPDQPKPFVEKGFDDPFPFSGALLLGWGFKTDRRTGGLGADPYGLGIGLRGGYVLDFSLYVGAYFLYYLGSSEEGTGTAFGGNVGRVESSASYMHFGLEGGYDVWVGSILLRPSLQIGMGLGILSRDGTSNSVGDLSFNPGVTVIHPIDEFFVGGDARGHLVTGDGISAVSFFATGGIRFE